MSQMLHGEADASGRFRLENVETTPGRIFEVMASAS
jgi:hypothetical protein